jgi:hypothetical protein
LTETPSGLTWLKPPPRGSEWRTGTEGQFLTAAPGRNTAGGFLLRVLSSKVSDGRTTVVVRPATLYEAVPVGSLVVGPEDFSTAGSNNGLNQVHHGNYVPVRLMTSAIDRAPEWSPFSFPRWVHCENGKKIFLTGEVRRTLRPHFDLRWGRARSWRGIVQRASARVDGSIFAEAEAHASEDVRCEPKPIRIPGPKLIAIVQVGPVPVPVSVEVPLQVSASVMVSGEARVSVHAGIEGSLGVEYRPRAMYLIRAFHPKAGFDPLPEIKLAASGEALIGPAIWITAGWRAPALGRLAAKVGVEVFNGVHLTYDVSPKSALRTCFIMN